MPSDGQTRATAAMAPAAPTVGLRPMTQAPAPASAGMDTLSAINMFRESDAETRELIRQVIVNNEKLDRVRARQQWSWLVVGTIISVVGLVGGLSLAFASHPASGAFVTIAVLAGLGSAFLRRGDAGSKAR